MPPVNLKQHRNAQLELDGRRLKGNFDVSLSNQSDREVMTQFINEIRKQMRDFDQTAKLKRKSRPRKEPAPAKKKAPAKKAKRKVGKRK